MQVKLTKPELFLAGIVGLWRKIQNIGTRRQSLRADDALDYDVDVRGAQGEIAFCKAMGLYPTGMFAFRAPDVEVDGEHFEVRTTPYPNGRLPIYKRDRDDALYVLVTGKDGKFNVRGWILGEFGKDRLFWDEAIPRPTYMVPQNRLIAFKRRIWEPGFWDADALAGRPAPPVLEHDSEGTPKGSDDGPHSGRDQLAGGDRSG